MDGVVGQPGGVVAIGVAAGEAEDPLSKQLERLMPDLARLAGDNLEQASPDLLRAALSS